MAKKKKQSGNEIPEWVVTYGDLMSLLLCFFILLVAFSEPKKPDEFRKVLEKIREALGFRGGLGQLDLVGNPNQSSVPDLTEVKDHGADGKFSDENNVESVIGPKPQTSIVHEGNFHAIGGTLAFGAGKTSLSLDVQRTLREEVAPKIRDRRNIVNIVGHAWGFQDQTAGDLVDVSFARARAVHDYLVQTCGVDRAILRPIAAGGGEPAAVRGDESQNRRVQVFMTDKTIDQVHPDPDGTGRGRN